MKNQKRILERHRDIADCLSRNAEFGQTYSTTLPMLRAAIPHGVQGLQQLLAIIPGVTVSKDKVTGLRLKTQAGVKPACPLSQFVYYHTNTGGTIPLADFADQYKGTETNRALATQLRALGYEVKPGSYNVVTVFGIRWKQTTQMN